MMTTGTYAWIVEGIVQNIIIWDGQSDLDLPAGVTLVQTSSALVGDTATETDGQWFFAHTPVEVQSVQA